MCIRDSLGPTDLDLWRFDGWAKRRYGGAYFFNDRRAHTPWGATRPDYGRKEVRNFLRDSAVMWLEDFRVDGLRAVSYTHLDVYKRQALARKGTRHAQSPGR